VGISAAAACTLALAWTLEVTAIQPEEETDADGDGGDGQGDGDGEAQGDKASAGRDGGQLGDKTGDVNGGEPHGLKAPKSWEDLDLEAVEVRAVALSRDSCCRFICCRPIVWLCTRRCAVAAGSHHVLTPHYNFWPVLACIVSYSSVFYTILAYGNE